MIKTEFLQKLSKKSSQKAVAWVSGVSGGKGERWKWKRERAEEEKRLTQMLLLEPSTSTQHDSIPSNQNHTGSLGCQLHVSKRLPKTNLTLRCGRATVLLLLWFRFFWNLRWEPLWIPLCVSIHRITTWNQNTLLVFTCGRWRQGVLWVIQSLPHPDSGCVTRFAEWFCVRSSFLFSPLPPPPPKISSPLAP